ncbi:MAG TPA: hypothetical protein VKM94_16650 [Blastocatellia bacterium]|nr:hypothetical protein [Blastocatellia bacterium]
MADSRTFSYFELSLMVFALEGGQAARLPDESSCEEACPVVENLEELLCGGTIEPRQQLVRHLNNHLREGLIETGMFELLASERTGENSSQGKVLENDPRILEAQHRLAKWRCDIALKREESDLLLQSLSGLSNAAWISMPRKLWKLRKKLKSRQ